MYIYKLKKLPNEGELHFGGKAESLGRLCKWGCPVPEGYAIAAEAFLDACSEKTVNISNEEKLNANLTNKYLKKEAISELDLLLEKLPRVKYAVRSSAIGEDGAKDSFAGAYETILDVEVDGIPEAICKVAASVTEDRVEVYAAKRGTIGGRIAVVIQRMIHSEYSGVLFTADVISGNRTVMCGEFVQGLGEQLVSGDGMDGSFRIHTFPYSFEGSEKMRSFGPRLYGFAKKIAEKAGRPQDLEWAVEKEKVYILQARPITTLFENDMDQFDINDSLTGELLLSKTNVGEIFLRPVSPATFGLLKEIGKYLGIPLISNVCGQLYINISGLCSVLMSFGMSKERAIVILKNLVGGIPEEIDIPVFPFDKKPLLKNLFRVMVRAKKPKGKKNKKNVIEESNTLIAQIRQAENEKELDHVWNNGCQHFIQYTLPAIMGGLSLRPLFLARQKLEKVCGSELTDQLLSDSSENGTIESLGSLLALDDLANGRMDAQVYRDRFGHRHADEMEVSSPYPYENPEFPENVVREYLESGMDVNKMKETQRKRKQEAEAEFERQYPNKLKFYCKWKNKYTEAVYRREQIRSEALRLFCVLREYYLKVGKLSGFGNDIFMLYPEEMRSLVTGNKQVEKDKLARKIEIRKAHYEEQMQMPYFPNLICGRFLPEEWKRAGSPGGYYRFGETIAEESHDVIRGVAGSCGQVEGIARVLHSIEEAENLVTGEILVVPAANIGWVKVFPKITGLVTDIGAPLSHAVIVARELGIPAVVSCQMASSIIKSGDHIKLDGTLGTVRIM